MVGKNVVIITDWHRVTCTRQSRGCNARRSFSNTKQTNDCRKAEFCLRLCDFCRQRFCWQTSFSYTGSVFSKQINTIQIFNIQPYAPEAAFHVCVHYVLSTSQVHASKASLEPGETNILHSMWQFAEIKRAQASELRLQWFLKND